MNSMSVTHFSGEREREKVEVRPEPCSNILINIHGNTLPAAILSHIQAKTVGQRILRTTRTQK